MLPPLQLQHEHDTLAGRDLRGLSLQPAQIAGHNLAAQYQRRDVLLAGMDLIDDRRRRRCRLRRRERGRCGQPGKKEGVPGRGAPTAMVPTWFHGELTFEHG